MKTLIILLLVFCLGNLSAQPLQSDPNPLETALNEVGLKTNDLTFDYDDMSNYGGDKFVLPLFYTLHSSPLKVEHYTKTFRTNILDNCNSSRALTAIASRRLDESVRRGLISNPINAIKPLLETEFPLAEAIINMETVYAIAPEQNKRSELQEKCAMLPIELRKLAAMIIYASTDTLNYHQRAFWNCYQNFDLDEMYKHMLESVIAEEDFTDFTTEPFLECVDFKYLYTPAQDIGMAVDFVSDSITKLTFPSEIEFEYNTSLGKIVINGSSENEYEDDEYLLIIDLGGNDLYQGGASNRSLDNWISIIIDVDGNDRYEAEDETAPSFGSGLFGYAYLVDLNGDDTYSGKYMSQGTGMFGVGVLIDHNGNDTYDSYVFGQGAGIYGQGILSDISGKDKYHMFQLGQGFGFTKGIGMLIDSLGDDTYIANDSIIDFPSSQSKEHNSSLCQGVGFGKRADFVDGHSWAGGVGMLIDGHGQDYYSAGLFAQGCAYWYAIGILSDLSGDDTYIGIWYVQGSGAHFGLGVLLESDGNDMYNASINMAQGAGHDFTLGMLIEEHGNDRYNAPNLSLGGGNANGIGIFWDKNGDDTYNVSAATTLGRANVASRGGLRDYILCLGLFLDTGGEDIYPEKYDFAKNNSLWTQPGTNTEQPLEIEKGVGYDYESSIKR